MTLSSSEPILEKPASHALGPAEIKTGQGRQEKSNGDHLERPTGLSLALIVFGICLALLCISLDRTIVATAVPRITSDFNSLDDAAWYGSAYLFGTCAFQLLFGKLYTRLSIKWTFVFSLVIFEIGSVICGAAPNSVALILGRAVAGIGCAGVTAGSLIIVAECVEVENRPKYTGGVSGLMSLAFVASPTLGGAFTENINLTWRWCFYINLPLGGVTLLAILFLFKDPPRPGKSTIMEHLHHLDLLGTVLFIPAVVSLLLALQWAGTIYPWSNWRIILMFCIFGVVSIIWALLQYHKGDLATIPPRIIAQRSIYVGLVHITIVGAVAFCVAYFVPIWFQAVGDYTPQQSGVNYLSVSLPGALFAVISGVMTSKIGYYVPSMYLGTIFLSVGAGLLQQLRVSTSLSDWLPPLILLGTGTGLSFQTALLAAQTVLSGPSLSIGTSLMVQGQTLGGAVFLAVAQSVFRAELGVQLAARVPGVDAAVVAAAGAAGLRSAIASRLGPRVAELVVLCFAEALRSVWILVLVLACLSLLGGLGMEWRSVKRSKGEEVIEV